jgi:ABC-type amino acid transport system permease subunit
VVIPSLGNEFITLIKDSSLAYTIGVVELYKQGITMRSLTLDAMTTYTAIALVYLVMTTTLSIGMNALESKLNAPIAQ